jgi:adenylate kinase
VRVLLVAPPGAGKGTQGTLIAAHFGIPHIATGDLLRRHVAKDTELGRGVRGFMELGQLIPDQVILDMVRAALAEVKSRDERGGYVLDGVPRTMEQARSAYEIGRELGMLADVALNLKADDDELIRRLLARASIEHRADDTEEVIRRRIRLYHEVTHPIVEWYGERGILITVDAMRPAEDVGREILAALEVMRAVIDHVPADARTPIDLTGIGSVFDPTAVTFESMWK